MCVLCSATNPGHAEGVRTAPVHRRMHRHADLRKLPQPRAVHMLALLLLQLERLCLWRGFWVTLHYSHRGKEGTHTSLFLFTGCSCTNRASQHAAFKCVIINKLNVFCVFMSISVFVIRTWCTRPAKGNCALYRCGGVTAHKITHNTNRNRETT